MSMFRQISNEKKKTINIESLGLTDNNNPNVATSVYTDQIRINYSVFLNT